MIKIPYASMIEIVESLAGAANLFDDMEIALFKADFVPDGFTTIADLLAIEADYTGYVRGANSYLSAYIDVQGRCILPGTLVEFQPSGTAVTNTIYGWFATNGTDPAFKLWYAERFPDPIPLTSPLNAITLTPDFRFTQPS